MDFTELPKCIKHINSVKQIFIEIASFLFQISNDEFAQKSTPD